MGVVADPETIYTKQNCIGRHRDLELQLNNEAYSTQVVAALERSTRGI